MTENASLAPQPFPNTAAWVTGGSTSEPELYTTDLGGRAPSLDADAAEEGMGENKGSEGARGRGGPERQLRGPRTASGPRRRSRPDSQVSPGGRLDDSLNHILQSSSHQQ